MSDLYYQMARIRHVELEIARRYPEQEMRCPIHLSVGQEAAAVGVCAALTDRDEMVSTHRGHAHYLAKGGSLNGLLAELYGKAAGCARGQGGSMHLVDRSVGFAGSTSIVGGTIPIGVGLAWAKKLRGERGVVAVCLGDAAIEEGVFHEAANFASLHKLKVLFVCENNLYSCFTRVDKRQPFRDMAYIAKAHGLVYVHVDGNLVFDVGTKAKEVVDVMNKVPRPVFMELETYRQLEHCGPASDDHLKYRDPDEVIRWLERDPLKKRAEYLKDADMAKITREVDDAFAFAKAAPYPEQSELGRFLYAHN